MYVDAACSYRRSSMMVCLSVCPSATIVSPAKTAEPIEMLFGVLAPVGPRTREPYVRWDAHWRNLANAIK